MDRLYNASNTYEKLRKDNNLFFELEIDSEYTGTQKIKLGFPAKRFRHCTGVEKLTDLSEKFISKDSKNLHTKSFYQEVRNGTITENDLMVSPKYNEPIDSYKGVDYFISDRLDNLSLLYDYILASKI